MRVCVNACVCECVNGRNENRCINEIYIHVSDPESPADYNNGDHNGALLYGTEYENTRAIDKNFNGDTDCAVYQFNNSTGNTYTYV